MLRKFSLILVLLLGFLQCLAPLLHAHPLGVSEISGAHFHTGLGAQVVTGQEEPRHVSETTIQEFPAISMESSNRQQAWNGPGIFAAMLVLLFTVWFRSVVFFIEKENLLPSTVPHPPAQAPPRI